MKEIDIGSARGIDQAIAFLKKQMSKQAMQAKADKIASVLVAEGADVARIEYGDAPVIVETPVPGKGSHKHRIVAEGPEVAFVEFGIGWGVEGSAKNEFAKKSNGAPDVSVGSYSKSEAGPFYRSGLKGWHYNGEWITGAETENLPRPGMEMARQYVTDERSVENAARKVIGDD